MKVSKLFLGLIGILAFASCSEDNTVNQKPDAPEVNGESRFMSVTIRNANGGRATGQTDVDVYENGLDPENEVNSLRFYFFDNDGNSVAVKADGTNFYDCTEIEPDGADMPNVEKKLRAVIVINTESGDNVMDLRKMVAVANMPASVLGATSKSLSELRAIVEDFAANFVENTDGYETYKSYNSTSVSALANPGFVMTSSTFGSGEYQCEVEIKASDIKTDIDVAKQNPVDVFIERVLAKVRVTTAWNESMEVIDVTFNGKAAKAIALKENNEAKTPITVTGKTDGEQVYVIFTGWVPTGLTSSSYAFKKVDSTWNLGWTWADKAYYRSYWAENPVADPADGLKYFSRLAATGKFGTQSGREYDGDFYYIQENAAAPNNNGKKSVYNPETQLSNRSQVYLGALLVTVKDGVATELELNEWGGSKYTTEQLVAAMLNVAQNQVFIRYDENKTSTEDPDGTITEDESWKWTSLTPEMVVMTSGIDIFGDDLFNAENDKRYLSYLQLVDNAAIAALFPGWDGKFYSSSELEEEITRDEVNAIFTSMPGTMSWEGGKTYYYADLKNLLNAEDFDEEGGYGVVRNTIYDVELNTVYGLGTPIYDPKNGDGNKKIIIPQKPTPDYAYIGARINILSWRVVKQGVNLEW
ncbi:MAG: fimbria major subunit [Muribaculum sp.]|nr:fimbria major subunit [Muribaculaceae bacterium]MCM1081135.1 fimbria major subunit [Muribaculum sp.]